MLPVLLEDMAFGGVVGAAAEEVVLQVVAKSGGLQEGAMLVVDFGGGAVAFATLHGFGGGAAAC